MQPTARHSRALVFWKFALRSRSGLFGSLLNLRPLQHGGSLELEHVDERMSRVRLHAPKWCCGHDGRLRLSSALAMLDEVSTYAGTVQWDRNCRPGKSVQLEGRSLRPIDIGPGDALVIETRLQKIGRTIGFVEITVENASGTPLIEASHVKFMPMGPLFDIGLHPTMQSLVLPAWEALLDRQSVHSYTMPEEIEEIFPFTDLGDGSLELAVTPELGNPIGGVHGGATVVLSQLAALRAAEDKLGRGAVATAIRTNLLSSVDTTKGRTVIARTEPDPDADHGPYTTRTSVTTPKGAPVVDTTITWSAAS